MSFFAANDPTSSDLTNIQARQRVLRENWNQAAAPHLFAVDADVAVANQRNCENMIGAVSVPVGLAGPVQVHAEAVETEQISRYLVPLATSEGALVASVNRGLKVINQAGGARVWVSNAGMTRAPVFALSDGVAARKFAQFLQAPETQAQIAAITQATSRHLRFQHLHSFVRGRQVFVRFVFDTGEAMGMNMVTIALQQLWQEFLCQYPGLELLALSSNVCTDKKPSAINQLLGRGWQAQAEVLLPEQLIITTLKTTAKALLRTHHSKNLLGSQVAGSLSQQMQFANVVAAFFLATGQDMAHVVEASQGQTILEATDAGIYAAVHLPNLPLGTVGGGTHLPAQAELRRLLSSDKQLISTAELAQILSVGVLAAELSGLAALSNHTLASAHQRLARGQASVPAPAVNGTNIQDK